MALLLLCLTQYWVRELLLSLLSLVLLEQSASVRLLFALVADRPNTLDLLSYIDLYCNKKGVNQLGWVKVVG